MTASEITSMIREMQSRHRLVPEMARGMHVPYHRRGEMSVPAFTMAPGGDPATHGRDASLRLMQKVCTLPVDLFFFDCEDASPDHPEYKSFARQFATEALTTFDFGNRITGFRPNNIRTAYFEDDLVEVITKSGHRLQVIIIPKTEHAGEVEDIIAVVRKIQKLAGQTNKLSFEVLIESPNAFLEAERIAAIEGVTALILGSFDLARTIGGTVDPDTWTHDQSIIRQQLPIIAAAYGKEAVDAITATLPVRPQKPEGMEEEEYRAALAGDPALLDLQKVGAGFLTQLRRRADAIALAGREAESARRCGYAAKWIIHPDQIEPIQRAWTPSREAALAALNLVTHYTRAARMGSGVELTGDRLADKAVVGTDWWLVKAALRSNVLKSDDISATGFTLEELERTVRTREP